MFYCYFLFAVYLIVYVANPSTNNITVIDGTNNKILSNISASVDGIDIHPFDIAINPILNTVYIVGPSDLAKIDLITNKIKYLNIKGLDYDPLFFTVSVNPFTNIVYIPDANNNIVHAINPNNVTINSIITVDDGPVFAVIDPNTNIIYISNTRSNTITKIDGNSNEVIFGIRFDITDNPTNYNILGINLDVNASKNVNMYCKEKNGDKQFIRDNEYIQYKNGTTINCSADPKNTFIPLISASWSGLDKDSPVNFNIDRYGTNSGSFVDLGNLLQKLSPLISFIALGTVIVFSIIHSIIHRSNKSSNEELEKLDIIAIDAAVIAGVLIFLSLSDGFEVFEQTQITIITVNIVFPFAISAVIAIRNHEHFAMTLMIAGFLNLMISVLLIALMRL
ncbi:MAG: YncE family protein [Nitrosopumilus sp.]|nr:YncE family protein [Nitrosopumilus sp.]